MLIEFTKQSNIYDNLEKELYGSLADKTIIYNFIPVKILNKYYILTCLKNLEGYLMDYKENIKIKLYLENETKILNLKSIISFTEKNYNPLKDYDCYIDVICNLVLIKFKYDNFNYIEIDNKLCVEKDIGLKSDNKLIYYCWTTNELKKKSYSKISTLKYIWEDKYINLPPIPYITDVQNINSKLSPVTGSGVFVLNEFVGMVSYITNYEIIITPIVCIKKLSKYLEGDFVLALGLDLFPVSFNLCDFAIIFNCGRL